MPPGGKVYESMCVKVTTLWHSNYIICVHRHCNNEHSTELVWWYLTESINTLQYENMWYCCISSVFNIDWGQWYWYWTEDKKEVIHH